MFGTVGWASPHNPKDQGARPCFVTGAGPTPLSPQRYQRWRRSCAAVEMVGPDGSFLAREILAGCYKQRILGPTPRVPDAPSQPTKPAGSAANGFRMRSFKHAPATHGRAVVLSLTKGAELDAGSAAGVHCRAAPRRMARPAPRKPFRGRSARFDRGQTPVKRRGRTPANRQHDLDPDGKIGREGTARTPGG
jgi:hypothetical protein